jgi:hypothetical protein
MKKISITLIIALFISNFAFSQSSQEFKPSGKTSVKIFTNYHSTFSDGKSFNAFEITRAYFGYNYNFSKHLSGKIMFDVGNPGVGGLQMTAYLKNAMLTYKQNGWTINFGLIGLLQFKVQEKAWGYRYILKSFQDQYKFGSSADLGMSVAYKFDKHFNLDFTITNGEGYKKIAADSTLRAGIGATINPVKEVTLRAYYDFIKKKDVNQQSLAFFAGYNAKKFSLGAEYNKQLNNKNIDGQDLTGLSFYGTLTIDKKWKFFGRYDDLSSNEILGTDWNIGKDGSMIIAGFEFAPTKGVKIAPNYQGWNPKDASKKYITGIFMNLEIKVN